MSAFRNVCFILGPEISKNVHKIGIFTSVGKHDGRENFPRCNFPNCDQVAPQLETRASKSPSALAILVAFGTVALHTPRASREAPRESERARRSMTHYFLIVCATAVCALLLASWYTHNIIQHVWAECVCKYIHYVSCRTCCCELLFAFVCASARLYGSRDRIVRADTKDALYYK